MTLAELTETFVLICEADETTTYVEAVLLAARTQLTAGGGSLSPFTSGSANGRNFNSDVRFDCAEMIRACLDAINMYDGDETPQFTVPSFHRM